MSGFSLGEAILGTSVDLKGLTDGLGRAHGAASSAASSMGSAFSNIFGGVLQGVGQAIFSQVAGGLSAIGESMIGGNAEFERYNVQFGVLLGSSEAAKERLAELADFGAKTPFELPQVVQADKILQSFGLRSENTMQRFGKSGQDILRIAGDVASGTGADFSEMSLLLGKFASGATGEAIARMQELGIVTREQLAGMGVEFSKSGQLLSPVDETMTIILQSMEDKFGGMMEAQSATFEGMVSNLQDWLGAAGRALGAPLFDIAKQGLGRLLEMLNGLAPLLGPLAENFANLVTTGNLEFLDNIMSLIARGFGVFGFNARTVEDVLFSVSGAFGDMWNSLSAIDFSPIVDAFGRLFGVISADAPPAGVVFQSVLSAIVAGVAAFADFLNAYVVPAVAGLIDFIAVNWPTIKATVESIMAGIQTVIATVLAIVNQLWSQWGDEILAVVEFVKTQWTTIFAAFRAAFEGDWTLFGETLRVAWNNAWDSITTIVENAILWFNTRDWGAIGTDILKGIAGGITAATGFIVDAAKRAVEAAIAALKGFLGISSPSRLLADVVGRPAGQGIARGWIEAIPDIRSAAIAATANTVTDARAFSVDARGANLSAAGIEAIIRRTIDRSGSAAEARLRLAPA